jgi:anti-sigma factor (TIGR02949 family)
MVCKLARSKLFEYLDGELSEEQGSSLDSHLAGCPDCRRLLELERAFRERYVEPLRPEPVPQRVRDQVVKLLDALPDQPTARRRTLPPLRGSLVAGLALFVLGALLGAGLGSLFGHGTDPLWGRGDSPLMRLADASVEQHQKLARGILPPDIQHVAPKAAEQWFKGRLNFNVSLPELTGEDLTLLGGRVSNLRDLEVAALHYQVEGKDVSLFIMPLDQYKSLGLSESPKFKMVTRQGYNVIVWASHGVAYSLVSEIGGRSCLVCHSREEKLDLPSGSRVHEKL